MRPSPNNERSASRNDGFNFCPTWRTHQPLAIPATGKAAWPDAAKRANAMGMIVAGRGGVQRDEDNTALQSSITGAAGEQRGKQHRAPRKAPCIVQEELQAV